MVNKVQYGTAVVLTTDKSGKMHGGLCSLMQIHVYEYLKMQRKTLFIPKHIRVFACYNSCNTHSRVARCACELYFSISVINRRSCLENWMKFRLFTVTWHYTDESQCCQFKTLLINCLILVKHCICGLLSLNYSFGGLKITWGL